MTQPKPLATGGRTVAVVVGSLFLLGAALPLLASLLVHGPTWYTGYGLAVVVLAGVMLVIGATGDPQRWARLRVATMVLCGLSFPLMIILQYLPLLVIGVLGGDPDSWRGWLDHESGVTLLVALLLLLPVSIFVGVVGRPRP